MWLNYFLLYILTIKKSEFTETHKSFPAPPTLVWNIWETLQYNTLCPLTPNQCEEKVTKQNKKKR